VAAKPVQRIEQAEPLPAVAASWKPPAPVVIERGRCWTKLQRLDAATLNATHDEFRVRNPGWHVGLNGVDPFTGRLRSVKHHRDRDEIGPAVELSDEVYQSRRLAALRRNADLFGLTAAQLDSIEWNSEAYFNHGRVEGTGGDRALGFISCRKEADRLAADNLPCVAITVAFHRDGVVSGVEMEQRGLPVKMCTTPVISEATVRATGGLDPNTKRPALDLDRSKAVGEPVLEIESSFGQGETRHQAQTATWRLVWEAEFRVSGSPKTFIVDAVSGERLSERGVAVTHCFPRKD
jgi:hypothetical protein